MVHTDFVLTDRTDEENGPDAAQASRAAAQLLSCPKAVLQRCHRGPEQQGQSHHEKILRLPNLQSHGTRLVSCTWKTARTKARPQFLLTIPKKRRRAHDGPTRNRRLRYSQSGL